MAEEQQQPLAAAFPAPPLFYKQFTAKNLARLKEAQQDTATIQDPHTDSNTQFNVPVDLQCLIPPEPPADGKFRSFGGDFDVSFR